jgi:hypothetical protein
MDAIRENRRQNMNSLEKKRRRRELKEERTIHLLKQEVVEGSTYQSAIDVTGDVDDQLITEIDLLNVDDMNKNPTPSCTNPVQIAFDLETTGLSKYHLDTILL